MYFGMDFSHRWLSPGIFLRVAQNEEMFEKCTSLGGMVFLLGELAMKKCFLKNSFISRGHCNITNSNMAALWAIWPN